MEYGPRRGGALLDDLDFPPWSSFLGERVASAGVNQFDKTFDPVGGIMCVRASAAFLRGCRLFGVGAMLDAGSLRAAMAHGMEVTLAARDGNYGMCDCQELPGLWRAEPPEPDLYLVPSVTYGNVTYGIDPGVNPHLPQLMTPRAFAELMSARPDGYCGVVMIVGDKGLALVREHTGLYVFDPHGFDGSPAYVTKLPGPESLYDFIGAYLNYKEGVPMTFNFLYWVPSGGWPAAGMGADSEERRNLLSAGVLYLYGASDADTTGGRTGETPVLRAFRDKPPPPTLGLTLMELWERRERMTSRQDQSGAKRARPLKRRSVQPDTRRPDQLGSTEFINLSTRKQRRSVRRYGNDADPVRVWTGIPGLSTRAYGNDEGSDGGGSWSGTDGSDNNVAPRGQGPGPDNAAACPVLVEMPEEKSPVESDDVASQSDDEREASMDAAGPAELAARESSHLAAGGRTLADLANRPPLTLWPDDVDDAPPWDESSTDASIGRIRDYVSDVVRLSTAVEPVVVTGWPNPESNLILQRVKRIVDRLSLFAIENGVTLKDNTVSPVDYIIDSILNVIPPSNLEKLLRTTRLRFKELVSRRSELLQLPRESIDTSYLLAVKVALVATVITANTDAFADKLHGLRDELLRLPPSEAYEHMAVELLDHTPDDVLSATTSRGARVLDLVLRLAREVSAREKCGRDAEAQVNAFARHVWGALRDTVERDRQYDRAPVPSTSPDMTVPIFAGDNSLDSEAAVARGLVADAVKKKMLEYADMVAYSISAFTAGTQSALGRFAISAIHLDSLVNWLGEVSAADEQIRQLAELTGRDNRVWPPLTSIPPVRIMRDVIEASRDLGTDDLLHHWASQLAVAHAANLLPTPNQWMSTIMGINSRAREQGLAANALIDLECEIRAAEEMDAPPEPMLDCARKMMASVRAAMTMKSTPEQISRLAGLEKRASAMLERASANVSATKERERALHSSLSGLLRPLDNYDGLRSLPDTLRLIGMTVEDAEKYVAARSELGLQLVQDARALLTRYQTAFSSLEFGDISGIGHSLLAGIRIASAGVGAPVDAGLETFLLQHADRLIDVIGHSLDDGTPESLLGAKADVESVIDELAARQGSSALDFLSAAAAGLGRLASDATTAQRGAEIKNGLVDADMAVAVALSGLSGGTLTAEAAEASCDRIRREVDALGMSPSEVAAEKKQLDSINDRLALLAANARKAREAARRDDENRARDNWLALLRQELERDRNRATFSSDAWGNLHGQGERFGGRAAVSDSLVQLCATVVSGYAKRGTQLLVSFFRINPYSPLAGPGTVGNRGAVTPLIEATWCYAFPTVSHYYESLFGAPTETLLRICRIIQETVAVAADTVDGSHVEVHVIVRDLAADFLAVKELEGYVDFYVREFESYRGVLERLGSLRDAIAAAEAETTSELDAALASAEVIRSPEQAKERLDRGEPTPRAIEKLQDLLTELDLIDTKLFTGTAYVDAVTHAVRETRRSGEKAVARSTSAAADVERRIKTTLSDLWSVREREEKAVARDLKKLKGLLVGRVPKEVVVGLEKAETLDDIVVLFLNLLRDVENSEPVDYKVIDWMIPAADIIDSCDLVHAIDDRGPLADYRDALESLRDRRDRATAFGDTVAAAAAQCDATWSDYSAALHDRSVSSVSHESFRASVGRALEDVRRLRETLSHPDRSLVAASAVAKYDKMLETRHQAILKSKAELDDADAAMKAYDELYATVPLAVGYRELEELAQKLDMGAAAAQPLPKWYRDAHVPHGQLVNFRLGLYKAYGSSGIVPVGTLAGDTVDLTDDDLPADRRMRARIASFMSLAKKSVASVTTHSVPLDEWIKTWHLDEAGRPLEYSVCYPTVCEKIAALWSVGGKIPSCRGQIDSSGESCSLADLQRSQHAALSLMAALMWISANESLIYTEFSSYTLFCTSRVWPARPGDAGLPMTAACVTYAGLAYVTLAREYGSAASVAIGQDGTTMDNPDDMALVAGNEAGDPCRRVTLTAVDMLILSAVCEPAHLVYFGRLDLLTQTEYMAKTFEHVMLRIVRERIGASALDPPADGKRHGRVKLVPSGLPERRRTFDPSNGSCFALLLEDWTVFNAPTDASKLLNTWKDLRCDQGVDQLIRLSSGGTRLVPMLMTLASICIPRDVLELMWDTLGPQDLSEPGDDRDVMWYMLHRSSVTDRYTSSPSPVPPHSAKSQSRDTELYSPAIDSTTFSRAGNVHDSVQALSAFDIALVSVLFGARLVLAYESSVLSKGSGLTLCTTVFDTRKRDARDGCIMGLLSRDVGNMVEIIRSDLNPIENACLGAQVAELGAVLSNRPLGAAPPLLFLINANNRPQKVLLPSERRQAPFVVTLHGDHVIDELPVRVSPSDALPTLKKATADDLFFSRVIGGTVPIVENPKDICPFAPVYDRGRQKFPFNSGRDKITKPPAPGPAAPDPSADDAARKNVVRPDAAGSPIDTSSLVANVTPPDSTRVEASRRDRRKAKHARASAAREKPAREQPSRSGAAAGDRSSTPADRGDLVPGTGNYGSINGNRANGADARPAATARRSSDGAPHREKNEPGTAPAAEAEKNEGRLWDELLDALPAPVLPHAGAAESGGSSDLCLNVPLPSDTDDDDATDTAEGDAGQWDHGFDVLLPSGDVNQVGWDDDSPSESEPTDIPLVAAEAALVDWDADAEDNGSLPAPGYDSGCEGDKVITYTEDHAALYDPAADRRDGGFTDRYPEQTYDGGSERELDAETSYTDEELSELARSLLSIDGSYGSPISRPAETSPLGGETETEEDEEDEEEDGGEDTRRKPRVSSDAVVAGAPADARRDVDDRAPECSDYDSTENINVSNESIRFLVDQGPPARLPEQWTPTVCQKRSPRASAKKGPSINHARRAPRAGKTWSYDAAGLDEPPTWSNKSVGVTDKLAATATARMKRLVAEAQSVAGYIEDVNAAIRRGTGIPSTMESVASRSDFTESSDRSLDYEDDSDFEYEGGGEWERLQPFEPHIRRDIYGSLAMTCRTILRGLRNVREYADEQVLEIARDTRKIKMLLG